MSRKVLFAAALTVAGFALTATDASAQRRGGRGTGIYGNQYYGNSYGSGITIPGTNYTIPGTGYSGNNYGSNYGTYGQPGYQSGYRSGQYHQNGQYYNSVPNYSMTPNYYTVPQTYGSTQVVPSDYSPSDTSQIAMLNVQLPMANAEVWLNDTLTTPQGMDRQFQSPPLDSSKSYSYTVKARWTDDVKVMEKTKDVKVEPGKTSTVSFR